MEKLLSRFKSVSKNPSVLPSLVVYAEPCPVCDCSDEGFGSRRHNNGYAVLTYVHDLQLASQNGCRICRLVLHGLLAFYPRAANEDGEYHIYWDKRTSLHSEASGVAVVLALQMVLPGKLFRMPNGSTSTHQRSTDGILEFFVQKGDISPHPCLIPMWNVPVRSDSGPSLQLVEAWLRDCMLNHSVCAPRSTRKRPSRLLNIISEPSCNDIRLVDVYEDRIFDSYITLSYCWGNEKLLTTTNKNLASHKVKISYHNLSKTFKDAITIARHLNIPYIWIDSLCIIQDDPRDWANESSVMDKIYEHSVLTILAAHASQGSNGCFSERWQWCGDPCGNAGTHRQEAITTLQLPFTDNFGQISSVNVRRQMIHVLDNERYARDAWTDQPLFSRAWAFQERILSTRLLYFMNSEIVFECANSLECECGGIERDLRIHQLPSPKQLYTRTYEQDSALWQKLVFKYMSTRITYGTDRLVALSGLAKRIRDKTGWTYIAGLWTEELPRSLLWWGYARDYKERFKPAEYRGPTWSWACRELIPEWDITLDPNDSKSISCIEVLRTEYNTKTADTTGEVTSASLHLRGPIMPLYLIKRDSTNYDPTRDIREDDGFYIDGLGIAQPERYASSSLMTWQIDSHEYEFLRCPRELFILVVVEMKEPYYDHKFKGLCIALSKDIPGVYERLAYVTMSSHTYKPEIKTVILV